MELRPAAASTCYFDVVRGVWVIVNGYHVELDGQDYVADRITDDFEADYRSNRPGLPPGFDADCLTLRQLSTHFFLSWLR